MGKLWDKIKKAYTGKSGEFPCIAKVLDVRKGDMEKLVGKHVIVLDGKNEYGLYPIKLSDEFPPPPKECGNWFISEEGLEFLPK